MSTAGESTDDRVRHRATTPYGLFIAVMTVFSLVNVAVLYFDWSFPFIAHAPVEILIILEWVDLFFCGLFLLDWLYSLGTARSRKTYLFGERPGHSVPHGVLELFGTVPFSFAFRLLRLARLHRMGWHLSDLTPRALYRAVLASRAESAVLVTVLITFLVLVLGSTAILYYELDHPLSSIDSAEDAFWWAIVTITTVGYGDVVPITNAGRTVGVLTMVVGIGIFGVIAGSLASLFTSGRKSKERSQDVARDEAIVAELAALREEVTELRRVLQER